MNPWANGRNIPGRYARMLDDYMPERTAAVEAVHKWEAGEALMLVLSGGVGTGKTFAAAEAVHRTTSARFLLRAEIGRLPRFDPDMAILERCPLLAIDDMGGEYADDKGHMLALLDALLDARYAHGVRTVITTNLNAAAFKARYGARMWDRIREQGSFVQLGEKSLRRELAPSRRRESVTEELARLSTDEPEPTPLSDDAIDRIADRFMARFRKGSVSAERAGEMDTLRERLRVVADEPTSIPDDPCEVCEGAGYDKGTICGTCDGSGRVSA